MKMESIGIADVLNKLSITVGVDSAEVRTFQLRFLTEKGTVSELTVRKYTRAPRQGLSAGENNGNHSFNLKKNGLVMLMDLTNNRTINIKACMIFGFKDFKSEEWLKVFH